MRSPACRPAFLRPAITTFHRHRGHHAFPPLHPPRAVPHRPPSASQAGAHGVAAPPPLPPPAAASPARRRPRTNITTHTPGRADELRRLYAIPEPPCVAAAADLAVAATRALPTFLASCPIPDHNVAAFERFLAWRRRQHDGLHDGGAREEGARPLCLDAACGRGWSSLRLASRLPHCDVVGVDKSDARLQRNAAFRDQGGEPINVGNALLMRADIIHFWRLCWQHGIRPSHQYILYPNPYPKKGDMKRRWHGHSIFPLVVALGGRLEVRASWPGYLHEFRAAYQAVCDTPSTFINLPDVSQRPPVLGDVELITNLRDGVTQGDHAPLSSFEAKYVQVGHPVYRLVIQR